MQFDTLTISADKHIRAQNVRVYSSFESCAATTGPRCCSYMRKANCPASVARHSMLQQGDAKNQHRGHTATRIADAHELVERLRHRLALQRKGEVAQLRRRDDRVRQRRKRDVRSLRMQHRQAAARGVQSEHGGACE